MRSRHQGSSRDERFEVRSRMKVERSLYGRHGRPIHSVEVPIASSVWKGAVVVRLPLVFQTAFVRCNRLVQHIEDLVAGQQVIEAGLSHCHSMGEGHHRHASRSTPPEVPADLLT